MSVSTTGGEAKQRPFHTTEALSFATTAQAVSLTTDVTTLPGGTGTDSFSLAAGTEGQWKEILMLATGQSTVTLTGTATGDLVLTEGDDYIVTRFTASKWRIVQTTATIA